MKYSQEEVFINLHYRKNITTLSRGVIYKPSLQAEILRNSQDVEFISHHYRLKYYKKYSKCGIYKQILQAEIRYLHSFEKNEIWRQ